ncbi:MAG: hypothetical protein J6L89_06360 [Clostridia bacterium]|nr:hypothetical protein [Clostridia bacterium]
MKKFIAIILVYCVIFTVIPAVFCAYVDPYNVMHPLSMRDTGVEPNKNFIKMTYILENPDKFDSFVFGSSRVGNIHVENIPDEHCYNMTYSNGLPKEHLANIRTFVENGIVPKKIYLGVDSLSYTSDPSENLIGYRMSYEYLTENSFEFFKNYLDPAVVGRAAAEVMLKEKTKEKDNTKFYEYGWNSDYNRKTKYDFKNAEPSIGTVMRMDETLSEIAEIVKVCKENKIELVVFTNPMHHVTYKASLEKDYIEFLRRLAEVTPYYNFSGYNDITTDDKNFIDSSHYTAEVSDMLIECMCKDKRYETLYEQGFGWKVTQKNADEFIKLLKSQ